MNCTALGKVTSKNCDNWPHTDNTMLFCYTDLIPVIEEEFPLDQQKL